MVHSFKWIFNDNYFFEEMIYTLVYIYSFPPTRKSWLQPGLSDKHIQVGLQLWVEGRDYTSQRYKFWRWVIKCSKFCSTYYYMNKNSQKYKIQCKKTLPFFCSHYRNYSKICYRISLSHFEWCWNTIIGIDHTIKCSLFSFQRHTTTLTSSMEYDKRFYFFVSRVHASLFFSAFIYGIAVKVRRRYTTTALGGGRWPILCDWSFVQSLVTCLWCNLSSSCTFFFA